jgi:hypothetical protein
MTGAMSWWQFVLCLFAIAILSVALIAGIARGFGGR